MKNRFTFAALALATLLSGETAAQLRDVTDPPASRMLPGEGPVQVRWTDPKDFSEIRYSRNRVEARRGDWVRRLAEHLQQQAAQALGPGERLELVITDIDLAGEYEPLGWYMGDVRVVRDLYPPRMQVDFVRYGADGLVLQQGSRRFSDPGFLSASPRSTHDALRFEKHMIEHWVRREFGSALQPQVPH